jgi:hypothetical protein
MTAFVSVVGYEEYFIDCCIVGRVSDCVVMCVIVVEWKYVV